MTPEDQDLLFDLLAAQRVLALSVLVDDAPYTGLLPFAIDADLSAALIHASGLARHTRGLQSGAPYSALIHQPDHPDAHPLQLPRITLQGTVTLLAKGSEPYAAAKAIYSTKFPQSAQTFMLGDFNLYALQIASGRFVAGFGRAYNIAAGKLRQMASQREG